RPVMASAKQNELIHRLLAGRCELCEDTEGLEVHHVRKLADLNKPGRREETRKPCSGRDRRKRTRTTGTSPAVHFTRREAARKRPGFIQNEHGTSPGSPPYSCMPRYTRIYLREHHRTGFRMATLSAICTWPRATARPISRTATYRPAARATEHPYPQAEALAAMLPSSEGIASSPNCGRHARRSGAWSSRRDLPRRARRVQQRTPGGVACNIALPREEFRSPNSPTHVEISVLRPDDLLNLEIVAVNLRLDTTDAENPLLVVDDPAQPALLVVGFPSQTIFEEAFFDSSAPSPKTPEQDPSPAPAHKPTPPDPNSNNGPKTLSNPGSVQSRLGGESRLVFKVPADARIPYTVAGLLDWSAFELAVSPIADVPNGATPNTSLPIKEPEATETTLQLPFRLHLSPTHDAVWQHDPNLVNHAGRVELWHTRLATRDANGEAQQLSADNQIGLRAIWSPD